LRKVQKKCFTKKEVGESCDKMLAIEWTIKPNGERIWPERRRGNECIRTGRRKVKEE
jgi:hypothetical protein